MDRTIGQEFQEYLHEKFVRTPRARKVRRQKNRAQTVDNWLAFSFFGGGLVGLIAIIWISAAFSWWYLFLLLPLAIVLWTIVDFAVWYEEYNKRLTEAGAESKLKS